MYEYRATVERVIDGDSLDVVIDLGFGISRRDRVRVYGVDAPETHTETRGAGLDAKAFVERECPVGSSVVLRTVPDREKYGRFLATVIYGDGVSLADEMIDAGLAREYYGGVR